MDPAVVYRRMQATVHLILAQLQEESPLVGLAVLQEYEALLQEVFRNEFKDPKNHGRI